MDSQEFAGLAEDANIYKLVGPILLKQDRGEAVLAVDGRLEFIDKEMYRWSPGDEPSETFLILE